jgi:hypothetical protein
MTRHPTVQTELPFGRNAAHRYKSIAEHEILSNMAHAPLLPPSWMTLYELTKINAVRRLMKTNSPFARDARNARLCDG